ncbi:hypothetical protein [Alkalihalophilus marmarensis]|nr:hypothetical protein [Alkalihalophilus marmarensis]MEC2070913.1 hypothetical protein [Alkalihalophilus marmarensis]
MMKDLVKQVQKELSKEGRKDAVLSKEVCDKMNKAGIPFIGYCGN